nr:hypothetical protein [Tanacetum cinerariifolium]
MKAPIDTTIYDTQFQLHVNNWIRYAFSFNVQDLDLAILNKYSKTEFVLDEFVFNNLCFTRLRLDGCVFNPTSVISWRNLRTLVILQGNLYEDLIQNILSPSPLLETLYLVVLLDVSSLVEAKLDYQKGGHYETRSKEGKEEMLKGLILRLRHTLARLEAKGFTFPSNLEYPDWPDYAIDSSGTWLDQLENPSPLEIRVKGLILTLWKKAGGPLEAASLPSGRGKLSTSHLLHYSFEDRLDTVELRTLLGSVVVLYLNS